jgi:hypothetical protein
MTIINDDSRVVNKLEASLTDDARVVIYNCHMFIVQATDNWSLNLVAFQNNLNLVPGYCIYPNMMCLLKRS